MGTAPLLGICIYLVREDMSCLLPTTYAYIYFFVQTLITNCGRRCSYSIYASNLRHVALCIDRGSLGLQRGHRRVWVHKMREGAPR